MHNNNNTYVLQLKKRTQEKRVYVFDIIRKIKTNILRVIVVSALFRSCTYVVLLLVMAFTYSSESYFHPNIFTEYVSG